MTLIFCPGLKFSIPTFAFVPEGFGTTLTGFFVVTLKLLLEGFGVGFTVALDDGLAVAFGVATSPSLMVTLIFCPGFKLSIPTFALSPDAEGLI